MSRNIELWLSAKKRLDLFFSMNPSLGPLSAIIISISLFFKCLCILWGLPFLWVVMGNRRFFGIFIPSILAGFLLLQGSIGNFESQEPILGKARLHIHEVSWKRGPFSSSWVLKGMIKKFEPLKGKCLRRLPFTLYLPKAVRPPSAHQDYWIEGELKKSDFYGFSLKVGKEAEFVPIQGTWSLAQTRYELKRKFKRFVNEKVPFKRARTLLIGMTTGDLEDTLLSFTFSRFGLNHLLAISGFHFGVLALFLNFALYFFAPKVRIISLVILLTAFYLFVGYGPSLQRAWIVALVYLWGSYFERLTSPINVLCVSMAIVLVLNPFMLTHLGFQFSFGVTFAILLYTRPWLNFLYAFVEKRTKIDHIFLQATALGLAVHMMAIPLSLYHFHKFYLMGFVFNLIIPPLVGVILLCFMVGLGFSLLIPQLGGYVLFSLGYLTEKLMQIIFWIPTSIDFCWRVPFFPTLAIVVYSFIFLFGGAFFQPFSKPFFIPYLMDEGVESVEDTS